MTHISSLVSDDSRNLYDRLRRAQCYRILESYGVPYPSGATKDQMIQIMMGSNIDPTKPGPKGEGVKFVPIQVVVDERGTTRTEMYPEEKAHATAQKYENGFDYHSEIEKRVQQNKEALIPLEPEETKAMNDRMDKLEGLVNKLADIIIAQQAPTTQELESNPGYEDLEVDELRQIAKDRGIKVHHKAGKAKLIEALKDG